MKKIAAPPSVTSDVIQSVAQIDAAVILTTILPGPVHQLEALLPMSRKPANLVCRRAACHYVPGVDAARPRPGDSSDC